MKKFTVKSIKLPKDVDEKYSQMNYLKEISKHIDDVKYGEKDDFVMFSASGHIEPLYLKNCIKHFESLQKRYTTQHNGQMCERGADALEALYLL